jgi:hypothetical protein
MNEWFKPENTITSKHLWKFIPYLFDDEDGYSCTVCGLSRTPETEKTPCKPSEAMKKLRQWVIEQQQKD